MKFVNGREGLGVREELDSYTGKSTEAAFSRLITRKVSFALSEWEGFDFTAQREKTLDKQLHTIIEQLAKQRLNRLWIRYDSFNVKGNAAKSRFKRTNSDRGFGLDHEVHAHSYLPYSTATKNETQTRLMYHRSAFVVYILALHFLVFIKISF
ncbi:hypothetical protein Bca52824_033634 [Brassica carinata]|uniref:Uncharacterized protein n=1 Tax=Brassica carinata TaxID=52824 RepID=A0A8X7SF28_BRACI|nr:hypothetical protein Bca52824_033634 [Brassica carinata]